MGHTRDQEGPNLLVERHQGTLLFLQNSQSKCRDGVVLGCCLQFWVDFGWWRLPASYGNMNQPADPETVLTQHGGTTGH